MGYLELISGATIIWLLLGWLIPTVILASDGKPRDILYGGIVWLGGVLLLLILGLVAAALTG